MISAQLRRPALLLVPCVLALVSVPAPASAGDLRGTYEMSSAGAATPENAFETAASATWYLNQTYPLHKDSDGTATATLTAAHQAPFTELCGYEGGTQTYSVDSVADPAARFEFGMTMDLLKGTGVTQVSTTDGGLVNQQLDKSCPGDPNNGVSNSPYEVMGVFDMNSGGISDSWPIARAKDGSWRIDGTRSSDDPDDGFGPATVTVHLRITGSLKSMNAGCTIPTIKRMRHITSFKAGKKLLKRAGFGKAHLGSRNTPWAKKGKFYVDDIANGPYAPCGWRLYLYKSLGKGTNPATGSQ